MRIFKIKLPLLAAIVAVAFTVGTTAFTKISNPPETYTFAYQLSTFDQDQVQKVTNWAMASPLCSNGNNEPCKIVVDKMFTHDDGGTRVLNDASAPDHITIVAVQGDGTPGDFVVSSTNSINLEDVANRQ